MRGVFIHDYDSENFIRYVSREAQGGVYRVVYIEKNFRSNIEDRRPIELIVADGTTPAKSGIQGGSGERVPLDLGRAIHTFHECPRAFDFAPYRGNDQLRYYEKLIRHMSLYGEPNRAEFNQLKRRVDLMEQRQGILFQAVEKMLKMLHWIK